MVMATPSGTPAATRLVTAVWRVLWNTKPPCFRPIGKPVALHAAAHAFLAGCPELLHQLGQLAVPAAPSRVALRVLPSPDEGLPPIDGIAAVCRAALEGAAVG